MSENLKKNNKNDYFWLTNKLNNVSFGPDPFVAGQGTVVPIQDFHFFFIGPSNSYYYHRDWHKCIGRMDQKSFGVTHVFSDLSKVINNAWATTIYLTANIFESGPMPTPWKFLDGLLLLPSCELG